MRPKAIADLAQLSNEDFFKSVARGLDHIGENVLKIMEDANRLEQAQGVRGVHILTTMASEEAGKFLILMDAVRCPRDDPKRFVAQLRRFNDHLAKGIYAESCEGLMGSFGSHREWIDDERKEYFLDGPNEVDWIFRNEILQRREQSLYVDYVDLDGDHNWWSPHDQNRYLGGERRGEPLPLRLPRSVRLVKAMTEVGFVAPEALAVIAAQWRGIILPDDFQHFHLHALNADTLKRLDGAGLLRRHEPSTRSDIIEIWPFPLHSLDLSIIKVDQRTLKAAQDRWSPYDNYSPDEGIDGS